MDLGLAIRDFLDHLRVERGLSTNTSKAYERDLHLFSSYCLDKQIDLLTINPESIVSYQQFLRNRGLSEASIQRFLSTIRSFFRYLAREKICEDPTLELTTSKIPRKLPKALTIEQITSLITATQSDSDVLALRHRALIELLYGTGARVSELVNLDVSDVSQFNADGVTVETVKLIGKGSKERYVPLGSFASKALSDYLLRLRPALSAHSKKSTTALFLNQRGTRLSRQSAWQFIADIAESIGLAKEVSPHVFRHSYATHLLDGGADIRVVQELLGHASVTTTQIYTLVTIDKIRETYSSAHPRARS
ncbi:unannotated protein [freshwater metagenome]|uniref:Tyrosine recombinase XerD n=1 Tax=freshwater metagenome TaxID=449393 RepID=A0A6J7GFG4_9ZZZZ|nr:site-specific tyrosine recombinase XerD [Actinomycetota bacterium]MSW23064.1 site-specific tyrosine recombinase XerD [Actinomycetota bacterium]MSW75643.1 site-specific tyrosine recombinase XerD [Actinomycetota bacterium]MSY30628.1 site-specific tyrosine recombinase XerD [Actinomycetota bacterium]